MGYVQGSVVPQLHKHKGCAIKKTYFWIFVLIISQLLYTGSCRFLCLPHIWYPLLCRVDVWILKIRCIEAEIWAKQKIRGNVFFLHTLYKLCCSTRNSNLGRMEQHSIRNMQVVSSICVQSTCSREPRSQSKLILCPYFIRY